MADSFAPGSPRSGQGARVRLAAAVARFPRLSGAIVALIVATPVLLALRGFTVDDALVTARMASHLAGGVGYRFNPTGPEVDAVTPLGFAHLLAAGGAGTPLEMLERARLLGSLGWLGAAATLGALLSKTSALGRWTALALLAVCTPAAAWASSGMETGLVTLLATLGVVRGPLGALSAGLAAALRPELVPYAAVLGTGGAFLGSDESAKRARLVATSLALALGPALLVAFTRNAWFGSPAPLSLAAKPPDLWPGLRYALAATLFSGPFVVLMAPLALRRSRPVVYRLSAALLAHVAAMALAGGDWMQLYRLAVPVLPAALLAGAELASDSSPPFHLVRAALALAVSLLVAISGAWPARSVLETRLDFIENLRVALANAQVTVTEDAGLVGAATPRVVFDLAGVTDPVIAHLSGGHASKRVTDGLIESRGADHAVLLLAPGTRVADPWQASQFARPVEARLASLPSLERFELVAVLGLGQTPYRYLVVAIRPAGQNR